MLNFITD